MASRILIVNSIGLTGSEMLIAALARHPDIAILPGQNFIGFGGCLYRDASYEGLSGESVFDSLTTEYRMRNGRIWSGMTKDMIPSQREGYDQERHRALFVAGARSAASVLDHAAVFTRTYFEACGRRDRKPRYLGFFGQNFVLSHGPQLGARTDCVVLCWDNRIDYWLANISQRMTWDCIAAAKFWIINHLILAEFAQNRDRFFLIDLERYLDDPRETLREIFAFLRLPAGDAGTAEPQAGFIEFRPEVARRILADAAELGRIYGLTAAVKMARRFNEWAPAWLADEANRRLLARYREFWNSTSHTNFDWIGPLEDEIFERAQALAGERDDSSLSLRFYHEYSQLNSLTHDNPRIVKPLSLGILEQDIVLPYLPFFLKIAIEHLAEQARIAERQAHSYRTIRSNPLYQRLQHPACRQRIEQLGLAPRISALEAEIDRAEQTIAGLTRRGPPAARGGQSTQKET